MKEDIEKIGILKYIVALITGKNRQFHIWEDINVKKEWEKYPFTKLMPDTSEEWDSDQGITRGDIVATISKNVIVITIPMLMPRGNYFRQPFFCKRWRENKEKNEAKKIEMDRKGGAKFITSQQYFYFIDSDNNEWKYDAHENKLLCRDHKGKLLYRLT
jgi:hypothetical protein